jgi:integrase
MAWVYQAHRHKQQLGDDAPWSVGWHDPEGRKKSKKIGPKSRAEKYARKVEGQIEAGTYSKPKRKSWAAFWQEWKEKIAPTMSFSNSEATRYAREHFERLAKPTTLLSVTASRIDGYVAKRRLERGLRPKSTVSPATINKELRQLKAALKHAKKWSYIKEVPEFTFLKEPEKLPLYVTPEHFAAIYKACDVAKLPEAQSFAAADWWRAFVVFLYMTGWRVGEPLALKRDDLDMEAGVAITRHGDNKGKRDERVPLHPIVIEHIERIQSFSPVVFPWPYPREALYAQLREIQEAAGIHLTCPDAADHECTPYCFVYSFHDFRRAFATVNAEMMSGDALQHLMRHKNYSTTQRYINMAAQVNRSAEKLHVPEVLRKKG